MIAKEGGNYVPAPVGTHIARCVWLIDIGTQHGEYKGVPNVTHKMVVGWELPHELYESGERAGKPHVVTKWYTISLGKKANLRHDLESWRGRGFTDVELRGFEVASLLNKACQVTIISKDEKTVINAVSGIPKGTVVPPQITPTIYFDLGEFNRTVYDQLSDGFKKFINVSDEWKAMENGSSVSDQSSSDAYEAEDSECPF